MVHAGDASGQASSVRDTYTRISYEGRVGESYKGSLSHVEGTARSILTFTSSEKDEFAAALFCPPTLVHHPTGVGSQHNRAAPPGIRTLSVSAITLFC